MTLCARLENDYGGAGTSLNRACLAWVSHSLLIARCYARKSQFYRLIQPHALRHRRSFCSAARGVDGDEVVSLPFQLLHLFSDSTGLHQLDPTTLHARLENNSGGAGTFEQGLPHLGLTAYDTARPFLYP